MLRDKRYPRRLKQLIAVLLLSVSWISYFIFFPCTTLKEKNGNRSQSVQWKSIWDPCKQQVYSCDVNKKLRNGAYILSLYDFFGSTIDDRTERKTDNTTYYDYAYASVKRLRALTKFTIILLVSETSFTTHSAQIQALKDLNIEIETVPVSFVRNYLKDTDKLRQNREKHKYTYYNLYIFSDEFTQRYDTLVFLDSDTFLLRNIDEVFCMDSHFIAAERAHNPDSDFNSGVYVYTKEEGDFDIVLDEYRKYTLGGNELKRGIQAVLNRAFHKSRSCLPVGYNCGGFQGGMNSRSVFSTKCPFKGENELLTQRHPVLHLKLSMRRYRIWLPSITCSWSEYLPDEAKSRVGWLADERLKCPKKV